MSQHYTGVLIAELLETFLSEVQDSLKHNRTNEAAKKIEQLRGKINGFVARNDRVLALRESIVMVAMSKQP
jgi:hypothetical protein